MRFLVLVAAIGSTMGPMLARAAEGSSSEPAAKPPVRDLSFRASLHGYDDLDANSGGVGFGGTALYRHDLLVAGGVVEHGSALWGHRYLAIAPSVGIALPLPSWARVEILTVAGAHHYSGVGKQLFSSDPGLSGTVPFVGARLYAGTELGGRAFRFSAGFSVWTEADLFRRTETYTYRETFLVDSDETVTRQLGMSRAAFALVLGGTFGL